MNCWQSLALEPTTNLRAIKKAYAHQLKLINQETEAEAFIKLREALQEAELTAKYQENFAAQQFNPAEQEHLFPSDCDLQQQEVITSIDLITVINLKYQHLVLQVEQKNFHFQLRDALCELRAMIEQLHDPDIQQTQLERVQRLLDTQDLEDFFSLLVPTPFPSINTTTDSLAPNHWPQFECCLDTTADCLSHTLEQLSQALCNQQIDDHVYAQFHLLLIQLDQFNLGQQLAIKDQLLAPLAEIDAAVSSPHFHRFLTLWQSCYPEDEQHYNEDYYPQKLQSKLLELRLFQSIGSTSPPFSAKSSILLTDPQDFSTLKMLDMQQRLNTYANQAVFEKFKRFSVYDNAINHWILYLGFTIFLAIVTWIYYYLGNPPYPWLICFSLIPILLPLL